MRSEAGWVVSDVIWNPPETAPHSGPILVDVGWPWAALAVWNDSMQTWTVAEMQWSVYQGRGDPCWVSASERMIRGWLPLPTPPIGRMARL